MLEMPMLKEIPGHDLEGAIALLNELKWSISVVQSDRTWSVAGGHRLILKTSSREAVDALLYAFALAYAMQPKIILDQFRKYAEHAAS